MSYRALIVDDEADILELVSMTLSGMNIDCVTAENLQQAEQALLTQKFDLCFTDMRLPDGNGLDLVETIQKLIPEMPVAVITAHGNVDLAVKALKLGAFDFVSKPVRLRVLKDLVNAALKLSPQSASQSMPDSSAKLLGETAAMQQLRDKISKLSRTQAPVCITGESGTGKELVARLIHESGSRAEANFVAINCGAIPAELVESELFGHKKGAFTGAVAEKQGLFEAADGGTLFLDEVADLPLMMQVKLLRAIQEKKIRPVGSNDEVNVDVRLLSATHQDLAQAVRNGRFREDLFYRLNVIELQVPPLRERPSDIRLLVEHIVAKLAEANGLAVPAVDNSAMDALRNYPFPGNVRELENILERAITWAEHGSITETDLMLPSGEQINEQQSPQAESPIFDAGNLESQLENQERDLIMQALDATRWNKTAAAKKLGISFRALRYKIEKLGLK